ncbi:MAG: cytochrome c, class I [Exilibacterium sp.]
MRIRQRSLLLPLILIPAFSTAKTQTKSTFDIDVNRAKFNYQMSCQGCHTPDGSGHKSVPKLKGFIGHFLTTQKGREYLIKVPGSANSALDDRQLAEVLNWMILSFGGASTPEQWRHYRPEEVHEYRKNPLFEVNDYRANLVKQIMNEPPPQ